MTAGPAHDQGLLDLVEIVELKWLLAAEGTHVHVEKLQADRDYACRCLAAAEASKNAALRRVAHRLRQRLDCRQPG